MTDMDLEVIRNRLDDIEECLEEVGATVTAISEVVNILADGICVNSANIALLNGRELDEEERETFEQALERMNQRKKNAS